MEEIKKEIEKMKDQIKTLRTSLLILSVAVLVLITCVWIRYSQIQHSLSSIVQYLQDENLLHLLTVLKRQAST